MSPAEQRHKALAHANAVRTGMSRLKQSLRAREITPAEALRSEWAPHFTLERFLLSIPGVGKSNVRVLLAQFPANGRPISPSKRLAALTPMQAEALREAVA